MLQCWASSAISPKLQEAERLPGISFIQRCLLTACPVPGTGPGGGHGHLLIQALLAHGCGWPVRALPSVRWTGQPGLCGFIWQTCMLRCRKVRRTLPKGASGKFDLRKGPSLCHRKHPHRIEKHSGATDCSPAQSAVAW